MTEEITTRSWGSRLKDAFIGILVGIGLIIGGLVLIFWNESHSLHMAQSLEQTQRELIDVPSSPINNQNNFKVIYLTGLATTQDHLVDPLLDIHVNAISLKRHVEMYQWQEKTETKTESQMGGSEKEIKTYTYSTVWSANLIDSAHFKNLEGHQNPSSMPVQSLIQYAPNVLVGDFSLPQTLVVKINVSKPFDVSTVNTELIKKEIKKPMSISGNELYIGQNAQIPQTGDIRINVTAVYPQNVSIIGQQINHTIQPFLAHAGESIILLSTGQHSAAQMIAEAKSENKMIAWILRAVTLLMLIAGCSLILNPLVVLADILPFLGTIVGLGTGFIAFICGLLIWGIATAIAWFATRPFISLGLLVLTGIVAWLLVKIKAKKNTYPVVMKQSE